MSIGNRVTHVDYPRDEGKIVGRYRSSDIGAVLFLVRWNTGHCSRHIESALVRCKQ